MSLKIQESKKKEEYLHISAWNFGTKIFLNFT